MEDIAKSTLRVHTREREREDSQECRVSDRAIEMSMKLHFGKFMAPFPQLSIAKFHGLCNSGNHALKNGSSITQLPKLHQLRFGRK